LAFTKTYRPADSWLQQSDLRFGGERNHRMIPVKSSASPLNFGASLCCSLYLGTALFFEFWSASRPKSARNFSKFPLPSSKTRYIER